MAQAIDNGALFAENTWFIHPASYFGFYPFSHRSIAIPFFFMLLLHLVRFLSFGLLGVYETVLIFDILLFIIIYKSSRNLADAIFEKKWNRIVFVIAFLFSPYVMYSNIMTVSTRLIITIIMISLLNICIRVLSMSINKFKATIYFIILFLLGSLTHRLFVGTLITILFVIFTFLVGKFRKIQKLTLILIPLMIVLAFIFGMIVFEDYITKFNDYSLITYILIIFFPTGAGIIFIFYLLGVLITIYKLYFSFQNANIKVEKKSKKSNLKSKNFRKGELNKDYYLLLFVLGFSFTVFTTQYSLVIFLPIIIIFSVYGLNYVKEFLSSKFENFEIREWQDEFYNLFPYILSLVSFKKLWLKFKLKIRKSNLINQYSNTLFKNRGKVYITAFIISIITSSVINHEMYLNSKNNSPYPWENNTLSDEEIKIIKYFEGNEIEGLIFVSNKYISNRIGGFGFLPTISEPVLIGKPLYYGLINQTQVYENTVLLLSYWYQFHFYNYTATDPIKEIRENIQNLNLTKESEFNEFKSYNIQYIISIDNNYISDGINDWILIQSLRNSLYTYSNQSVFQTNHFLIWRIY